MATAFGAFFFMPITLAFSLGQAQIFLDLFFALLVLFWVQRKERPAGVMMALPGDGEAAVWAAAAVGGAAEALECAASRAR